jgi:hypothetical protein
MCRYGTPGIIGAPVLRSEQEQRLPSLLNEPCLILPVLLTSQTSVSSGAQVSLAETSLALRVLSDAQAASNPVAITSKVLLQRFITTGLFEIRACCTE